MFYARENPWIKILMIPRDNKNFLSGLVQFVSELFFTPIFLFLILHPLRVVSRIFVQGGIFQSGKGLRKSFKNSSKICL